MHLNRADIVTDHGLIAATETTPHPPFQKLLHFSASHHHLGSTAPSHLLLQSLMKYNLLVIHHLPKNTASNENHKTTL